MQQQEKGGVTVVLVEAKETVVEMVGVEEKMAVKKDREKEGVIV